MRWLFFSYTLPSRPSRARVSVWRQVKKLGAVNHQSVWVLPYSNERVSEVRKLIQDIENWKGEGLLIDGKVLNKEQEARISKAFVESRNEEYKEIIGKCEDYAKEIEFEIDRQNFIFAEVEENEEELEKLKQWLKKVEKRDIVEAPLRKAAAEKIKTCETLFQDFALKVYEHSQLKDRKRRKIVGKEPSEPQE
ncbi:MAG: chromate resistance protein ChrB [Desulfomonile tiedjei]|uniref:Chromate resistance protein ChrB n=1 Tax=Desulfomonile tiedjei TaxID=2358 RepID=A0A9D6Z663_9BACT|nr:chromate resistance protein ChrB [Desulfomonile tiedjei]